MKKFLVIIAFFSVSVTTMAQEGTIGDEKHSVITNPFWANWFVQANMAGTSFWGSQENSAVKLNKLFKSYRTNLGFSFALGKWFTPGIGLRTKFNGVWGRTVLGEDKAQNASRYWTLQEQALFNLSNMLMGYNEQRVWNFIPYIGAGVGRNMSYNTYGMGLSIGLLNTFRINRKWAVNLDISYGAYEPGFDGCRTQGTSSHSWKNKDRVVNVEVGLTYRLGKPSWKAAVAQDAMNALTEGEIDALNGMLADAQAENDRLQALLDKQSKPAVQPQPQRVLDPQVIAAPVSVFFDLNKSVIASQRDMQNVADLVALAKEHNANLVVTGYADSDTGQADYNRELSQKRADTVVAEILKMGFPSGQIEIKAAGGVNTLTPSPYNRRVTVEMK